MARSRNIKPAFFQNDELAELEPLIRLYFIGLWTICDFKGCLEYRPKKIKAQILPYDDCNLDQFTNNLDQNRFIRLYSVGDKTYIKILTFAKHQNPHKNEREAGSDIPDIPEDETQATDLKGVAINTDKIGTNTDKIQTDPADSLLLIPDSLNPIKKEKAKRFVPPSLEELTQYISEKQYHVDPETFINHYESNGWKVGKNKMVSWKSALVTWVKREEKNTSNQISPIAVEDTSFIDRHFNTNWREGL